MLAYRTPGVYFESLDQPAAVQGVRTDIAGFVGVAARGPLWSAQRLTSFSQFTGSFGAHIPQGYLAYAVEGFFANGGQACWVVRVADDQAADKGELILEDPAGRRVLRLRARSPGSWAHQALVSVTALAAGCFSLELQLPGGARESWPQLCTSPGPRFAESLLNAQEGGSGLVQAEVLRPLAPRSGRAWLGRAGLGDGLTTLTPAHVVRGLAQLEKQDEVSIVAVPDIMPALQVALPRAAEPEPEPEPPCAVPAATPQGAAAVAPGDPYEEAELRPAFDDDAIRFLQLELVRHCEQLRDRMAVLDPRPTDRLPESVLAWRLQFDSSYAAAYFPWLRVADPLRLGGLLRAVPPSGHMAGVWARTDTTQGVYKPPANEPVEAAADLLAEVDDATHGGLNDERVNALRATALGIRVQGARTLGSDPEWRFLNVRRLFLMIEEAIESQTQWTAFEPGNPELWRAMDRVVRGLLQSLWERGWLDGATPDDAFSVACDETTNPPEETAQGRTICRIGIRPPWPAEFVVVRIGRVEGSLEIVELRGGGG